MTRRGDIGAHGESLAAQHLTDAGWRIRHRNWRHGHGELDIVAERDGKIAFVEVRTRTNDAFGSPEESLTPRKRAKLIETAQAYLAQHQLEEAQWQLDVIAIELDARLQATRLDWYENAFS